MLGKEGLLGSGRKCGAGDCCARVVSWLHSEVEFMDLSSFGECPTRKWFDFLVHSFVHPLIHSCHVS